LTDQQRAEEAIPKKIRRRVVVLPRPRAAHCDVGALSLRRVDLTPLELVVNRGWNIGEPTFPFRAARQIRLTVLIEKSVDAAGLSQSRVRASRGSYTWPWLSAGRSAVRC
jgi:hypothetical protein